MALRRYTIQFAGRAQELAVWVGTPAEDIEHCVRTVFGIPQGPTQPALLWSSEDGTPCVVSSHAPNGTVFVAAVQAQHGEDGASAAGEAVTPRTRRAWSALGVTAEELRWSRFQRGRPPALPLHLESNHGFTELRANECREAGKPYVDTEPASLEVPELPRPQQISFCMRSSGESAELEAEMLRLADDRERKNKAVAEVLAKVQVWRRPQQYAEAPKFFPSKDEANELLHVRPPSAPAPPWLPAHMPLFVRSSAFADTFFALALSVVAARPEQLANLFVSCEHGDVGLYTCQFSRDEATFCCTGWKCVSVDDSIPCGADLRPVLTATECRNELWSVLLHKAYAKFLGSYSHLHVGDTAHVLRHFTGVYPDVVEWDAGMLRGRELGLLWFRLSEAVRLGLQCVVMKKHETCPLVSDVFTAEVRRSTSRKGSRPVPRLRAVPWNTHLHWDNGVLISFAAEVPCGRRETVQLIKLRDMYGGIKWQGDWSDQSTLWTKQLRELLGHREIEEHVTWMKLADFAAHYDTLLVQTRYELVCPHPPGPPACFFRHMPPCDDRGALCMRAHQYFLDVEDADGEPGGAAELEVQIQLSQPCLPPEAESGAQVSPSPRPCLAELQLFVRKAPGQMVCVEQDQHAVGGGTPAGVFSPDALRVPLTDGCLTSPSRASPRVRDGGLTTGARGEWLLQQSAVLPPGNYALVVLQQATGQGLHYCLHVSSQDERHGLCFSVAEGGSAETPGAAEALVPQGPPLSPPARLIQTNPARRPSPAQYI
eukprot:TRINITY_DN216_c0_g1_i1.p1 TRINITY_DN216_c0_g1~~TRINITY_DN216_c0_g1_i1.p1  ORF type:complete len:768 (+),score=244.43 TRINITY_DN216_c0_g1_i1:80-2383(+)